MDEKSCVQGQKINWGNVSKSAEGGALASYRIGTIKSGLLLCKISVNALLGFFSTYCIKNDCLEFRFLLECMRR